MSRRLITAIEIDGAGGHPGAWRGAEVDPAAILTGELALRAVQRAEAAGIDLATFTDTLEAPADVPDQVSVRLDALGLAGRIAPATDRIGLLPTISVTHTEPFHVQASVATLDYVSSGRGGWIADVSTSAEAAAVIGRREPAPAADTWREARYVVDVSRRLWDSWEDDAIIRDASTGRFVDRTRIHYVDFDSPAFSIKGPSIVPRPPQGHPVTAVRVNAPEALEAAADAEVVLLPGTDDLAERVAAVRAVAQDRAATSAGRASAPDGTARVLVTVGVLLDEDPAAAARRADGATHLDHIGGVERLADLIGEWKAAGVDGVHLRPASLELDVPVIAERLVPLLRARKLVGPVGRAATLRQRLGLGRPANRYAGSGR
jgi:alkanesulfonate monooxygenase SsuD/methylene tetrahydromethanopterin reductase-like flavin-dependent oxidoreductase (luciferase family)